MVQMLSLIRVDFEMPMWPLLRLDACQGIRRMAVLKQAFC